MTGPLDATPQGPSRQEIAKRALPLVDLTDLSDNCTPEAVDALCKRAQTKHGNVAAVCVWPAFVAQAKKALGKSGVKVATVVNFPHGGTDIETVITETEKALADGADEIDLVFPYHSYVKGKKKPAIQMVEAVRAAVPAPAKLKLIIEIGILNEAKLIRGATHVALDAGCDFVKTSTGKVPVNATPRGAKIMFEIIKKSGGEIGFKAAGGIRSTEDAGTYLAIADHAMHNVDDGKWVNAEHFRFGASGVLDDLIAAIEGKEAKAAEGY